jgi:hypothetical protein
VVYDFAHTDQFVANYTDVLQAQGSEYSNIEAESSTASFGKKNTFYFWPSVHQK